MVKKEFADFDNSASTAGLDATVEVGETSTAVAVVEDDAPSRVPVAYSSSTDFDPEDSSYLRLKLIQPQAPEIEEGKAKGGQFLLSIYPAMADIDVVPVMFGKSRTLREPGSGMDRKVLCVSGDGKIGLGDNGLEGNVHECNICPKNQWRQNPDPNAKTNLPPECSEEFNFVLYVPQYEALCEYKMQKTALTTGKQIIAMVRAQGWGSFVLKLTSKKQSSRFSPTGYYVPQITVVLDPAPGILARARQIAGIADEILDLDPSEV